MDSLEKFIEDLKDVYKRQLLDLEAQYENLLKGGIGAFNLEDIKRKIRCV